MPVPKNSEKEPEDNVDSLQDLIQDLKGDFKLNITDGADYLSDELLQNIGNAFIIISKYKDPANLSSTDPLTLQADSLALQAMIALNSRELTKLIASSEICDDTLKVKKSKASLEAKRIKKEKGLKITVESIKDVTSVVAEEYIEEAANLKVASEFAKFVYYTVRDFAAFLDRATSRALKFDPEVR